MLRLLRLRRSQPKCNLSTGRDMDGPKSFNIAIIHSVTHCTSLSHSEYPLSRHRFAQDTLHCVHCIQPRFLVLRLRGTTSPARPSHSPRAALTMPHVSPHLHYHHQSPTPTASSSQSTTLFSRASHYCSIVCIAAAPLNASHPAGLSAPRLLAGRSQPE